MSNYADLAAYRLADGTASPDAELIRMSGDLLRRAVKLHRCDRGAPDDGADIAEDDYEAEHERMYDQGEALMQMHPVTMEGLLAKAQVVRVEFERLVACDEGGTVESCGERHDRLAWSVLNDLLEMMGRLDGLPTFGRKRLDS